MDTLATATAAIEAVFESRRDELVGQVLRLEGAVAAMSSGALDAELRAGAERDAHKLAGSLGMFGLPRGSELARELEQSLAADAARPADAPRLAVLVHALHDQLVAGPGGAGGNSNGGTGAPAATEDGIGGERPAGGGILLVGSDAQLTDRLSGEALRRNLRARVASTSADARLLAAAEPPDAVVLDVSFDEDSDEMLTLLDELTAASSRTPVVVLTSSETLIDRVEVVRRGGHGFVQRARPAAQVIDAVGEAIEHCSPPGSKLLAVDDDPTISAALEALLSPHGLRVSTLNDPLRFWEVLKEVDPDLLVLDLDLPGLNGIELCQAVRADERFGQVPVLFLTASADVEGVQRIFEAGADDYVTKPIVAPELITRILNRLERIRVFRQLADRDALTGVASRRRSTEALEDLIAMSKRFDEPVSLAMIDLDHFKQLNDRLGHAAGDAALSRFGAALIETFRGEDVVGRWGGEEFIVAMYGMSRDDGVQRMTELLEAVRQERFAGRDGTVAHLSFSAGVAEYPGDGGDLHDLYRAADAAMYAAKEAGRDRVLAAGASTDAPHRV